MKKVIISQRAYLSMLAEVYERVETETGGILLGHREGDIWYVLESVEPGPKSTFTPTYFEYDDAYVTYRANKLSRLYKCSINLLGLWHRHPSLMKTFSSTDDETNKAYSDMLGGAISGIVTLGNGFEITMYYVPSNVRYEQIEWVVDDKQIPTKYLSYYDTEYYKSLINNEASTSHCITGREVDDARIKQKKHNDKFPQSGIEGDQKKEKKIKSISDRIVEKIHSVLKEVIEDQKDNDINNKDIEKNKKDIGFIFDSIEPEIAYLQSLEHEGKLKCQYGSKKDRNGKDRLILKIVDMRQNEKYSYRLIFFVNEGRIMVKTEDGKLRPYTDKSVYTILGG